MPWSQTSPMDRKAQFIADYLRKILNITDLSWASSVTLASSSTDS